MKPSTVTSYYNWLRLLAAAASLLPPPTPNYHLHPFHRHSFLHGCRLLRASQRCRLGRVRCPPLVLQARLSAVRAPDSRFVHTSSHSSFFNPSHAFSVEHNISGDILCALDSDSLKDMGVTTIGQRLAILKAIYLLKLQHNIPIEPEDYVPPC